MKIVTLAHSALAVAALAAATASAYSYADAGGYQEGTVKPAMDASLSGSFGASVLGAGSQGSSSSGGYLQPFATDAPSESLFARNELGGMAPVINVASELLGSPLPTNKWWGNLIHTTAADKDTVANPAWANPYALKLPKAAPFGIQACYSYSYRQTAAEADGAIKYYLHDFHNDMTLSASEFVASKPDYEVYGWTDTGVYVRTCASGSSSSSCMDSALVNGMAFVSATYAGLTPTIQSDYAMTIVDATTPGKTVVQLASNNQMWVLYGSDASLSFSVDSTSSALVAAGAYTGTIRMAVLPESGDQSVYDDFAGCVVRGGVISVESRTEYSFNWVTNGTTCESSGLLHFALPHHSDAIRSDYGAQLKDAVVLHSATRGRMTGVVTTSGKWSLTEEENDAEVDFYPATKPSADVVSQVNLVDTLQSDIDADWTLDTGSWYYNGKAFQKYATLCLMAADSAVVGDDSALLTTCLQKIETLIEPFLDNTLDAPLCYETTYGGIVSSMTFTSSDVNVEFGNAVYNDHHYHYGYWVTASAILKKLAPDWARMSELDAMVTTLLRDVVNPSPEDRYFPTFRHFSWFLGHSYSHGVTPMADGKDEESTSEDINFYYGMKLWGQATGNKAVEDLGSLMLRINARAVRTYFLMASDNEIHPAAFVKNHVTGIFFDNKADYATWFSAEKYCIHGIQMIPVSPINALARTATFVQQEWDDILSKEAIVTGEDLTNAWLSLLLVNEAFIDQADALAKLPAVTLDDGLTRSWALYNAATRGGSSSSGSAYASASGSTTADSNTPEVTTTAAPAVTSAAPTVTAAAPTVTTVAPAVTTAAPAVTTTTPTVTSAAPTVTAAAPGVTTAAPVVTTAAPTITTAAPAVTTAAPGVSTAAPAVSTAAPAVTTAAPCVATATPAFESVEQTQTGLEAAKQSF